MTGFIENLRLNEDERKVYEILLGTGQLTDVEIKEFAHAHISKVQQALKSLLEKGAVGVTEGYINKYFARIPLGYLAEISSNIRSEIENKLNSTDTKLEQFRKQLEEKGTNLQNQLKTNLDTKQQQFEEKMRNLLQTQISRTEEQKSTIENKVEEIGKIVTNIAIENKNNLVNVFKENVDTYNAKIDNFKQSINSELNGLTNNVGTNVTNTFQHLEELTTQFSSNLNTIDNETKPKMNEISTTVLSEIDNIHVLIKNSIDLSKLDASSFHKEQVDKYLELSSELSKKATDTIDGVNNSVFTVLKELDSRLESIFKTKTNELTTKIQETLTALSEQIAQIKEQTLKELLNQKNSTIESTIAKIKDQSTIQFADFQNIEQKHRNGITSERDMFLQKLNAKYTDTLTAFEDTLKNMKEQVNTRLSNTLEIVSSKLTTNIADIQETITQFKNNFTETVKTFSEQLNKNISEKNTNIENLVKETKTNFEQLVTTSEENLNDKYDQTAERVNSILETMLSDLNNYFQELTNALNASIEDLLSITRGQLEESKVLSEQAIVSQIQDFAALVNKTSESFRETAASLMNVTGKLATDFQTIEAHAKGIEVPKVETSVIIGEDAVISYIARIIENVKRQATLIVPKIDYVPVDVIKSLKTGRNIRIVLNNANISEDWIREVTSSQATIEILVPRGTMLEEAVYVGVVSGEEEILIGTIDEATKEVVAIISSSRYFSRMLTKLIVSDAMRGKEKIRI